MPSVLEDKDAIRELIAEYCYRIDDADYDRWVELFAEDGRFAVEGMLEQQGRDNLLAFTKSIPLRANGRPAFKHCTLNQVIDVDGDRATARCYLLLVNDGDPLRVDVAGRYDDELVRTPEGWRFASRTASFDLASLPGR